VDPTVTGRLLKNLKLSKSLFIVISKSGNTAEPMALYGIFRDAMAKTTKNWQKHFVFITDAKGGLLRPIAKKEKIATFSVPDKIGGRFSVLTSVGLVPAALCGISITKLLKGAKDMGERIKKTQGTENPALTLATLQYLMDRKKDKPMTVLMPYSNLLFRMGDWYRQLLAESIGKNKKTGPTPINALGTTDQHSQIQLYMEGPMDKWIIFMRLAKHSLDPSTGSHLPVEIGFLNHKKLSAVLDASFRGTSESLANNGRPNLTIEIPKIDEENLGALFVLFEFQVALLGIFYGVNAFDQPGVEHGKILTKRILSESQ
jgi:glucose-6-phosphate isomerase